MKKLSLTQIQMISLMLFSLFFGAGNLIFPPMVGRGSGVHVLWAMVGFAVTAVILPIFGTYAVSKNEGLFHLASHVHPIFATAFTIIIFMSIGPFLGIPRAGSLPFELAIAPYLPSDIPVKGALFVYTLIFFGLAFWISLVPSKLVTRMGKFLTPMLLTLIFALWIGSFFAHFDAYQAPVGNYVHAPVIQGFLDGYSTMDAVASLNFGVVIGTTIRSFGFKKNEDIRKITLFCGMIAGSILLLIYLILSHFGAASVAGLPEAENGAVVLTYISTKVFGAGGAIVLASIFSLACLTTCVGLLTSLAHYFHTMSKKMTYTKWLALWTIVSLSLANFGLSAILKYSVPALIMMYPVAIVLILLGVSDGLFMNYHKVTYRLTIFVACVFGVTDGLLSFFPVYKVYFEWVPLFKEGMMWLIPCCIAYFIALAFEYRGKMIQRKQVA